MACNKGSERGINMTIQTDVLIVGGGFAGVSVAQSLEKQGIKTILVDKKDYFEVTFATLRNVADPSKTKDKARKLYKHFLSGRFIHSAVSEMTAYSAILEDGTQISFKNGIIASGTRYSSLPMAKSDQALQLQVRNDEMLSFHRKLKTAKKVMIIGGGVVGVELAGEVAFSMPNTQVTLAHNAETLLNGFKEKTQRKSLQQLQKLGVKVEFNRQYQNQNGRYIDQVSGDVSDADLVYEATGVLPNNSFLQPKLAHILNEHGFVKVDENLQVKGEASLYALGDIADVGEAKMGYLAVEQGRYLAKVIMKKRKGKIHKGYKRNPLMAMIPVGAKQGVFQLSFAVTTSNLLVGMKQKDLFISKVYQAFGATSD